MLQLTFKQTDSELMVRAAATVLFSVLKRQKTREVDIAELAERPQYGFTASANREPVGPKLVRITDLKDGKIDWNSVPYCDCIEPEKYLLSENDILFARTGATTGKTHFVRSAERAVFASYLIRLRPKLSVDAGYLYAFFQSDNYWSQISEEKEGSAQPNVNGDKLASLKIPIVERKVQRAIAEFLFCVRQRRDGDSVELPELPPPLAEQRQIVARIEELAAKLEEARGLRQQATDEAEALIVSTHLQLAGARTRKLGDLLTLDECQVGVTPTGEYPQVGVRGFGGGLFLKGPVSGTETTYRAFNQLYEGALVLSQVKGWEGAVGVCESNLAGWFVSPEYRTFRCIPSEARPDYLAALVRTEWFWGRLKDVTRGVGARRERTRPEQFLDLQMPMPDLEQQEAGKRVFAEVRALKGLQAETVTELNALMPSILDKAFRGEL
jgi:type I restriction enzyme, S subunit